MISFSLDSLDVKPGRVLVCSQAWGGGRGGAEAEAEAESTVTRGAIHASESNCAVSPTRRAVFSGMLDDSTTLNGFRKRSA